MLDFRGKLILAPMVRVSTLPVRLLCLQYGADIVYSEEIVDHKLLAAVRCVNERLGTIDYVDPADGIVVLRTCAAERHALVLQMGTSDPQRAALVARKYERDVAGIDVNMGCPKEFSMRGGMGAALLVRPQLASDIVRALVASVNLPITCKIRLVAGGTPAASTAAAAVGGAGDMTATLQLCRLLEAAGAAALTVHGRTRHHRPRHANNNSAIGAVVAAVRVPVIANGGSLHIRCRADIERFRVACGGAASVMVARAAMWNMSVFGGVSDDCVSNGSVSNDGVSDGSVLEPLDHVITKLLRLCIRYDHPFTLVKYTVQQMLRELQETPRGKLFLQAQTVEQICELWSLGAECRRVLGPAELVTSHIAGGGDVITDARPALADDVIKARLQFVRGQYNERTMPKTVLHNWCRTRYGNNTAAMPVYSLQKFDKLFRAVCRCQAGSFASAWEKNKKFAEQGAALTCVKWLCIEASDNGGDTINDDVSDDVTRVWRPHQPTVSCPSLSPAEQPQSKSAAIS